MKILNCILFLAFLECLYVGRAAGMFTGMLNEMLNGSSSAYSPHSESIYVTVGIRGKDCRLFGFAKLLNHNKLFGDPPSSLRPTWMTHVPVGNFEGYSLYMEMSNQRRYGVESLIDNHSAIGHYFVHYPEFADFEIGEHIYEARKFNQYNLAEPHSEIAPNKRGGRMYITIEHTKEVYYADFHPRA